MRYPNIPEEELKIRVGEEYFSDYDCATKIGKVDFCVLPSPRPPKGELPFKEQSLLWAEAKANKRDVVEMFAQLILTIGKARTFAQHLPPAFLGVFDAEKIAFVAYEKVQQLFFVNDFNWNVAPSDHGTKEFSEISSLISGILESEKHLYHFGRDDRELRFFIQNNLAKGTENRKIQIDKNNFLSIYLRWYDEIKPLIRFNFEEGKERRIIDSDFYLADLFVDDNDTTTIDDDVSIRDDLFVIFKDGGYRITKENLASLFDGIVNIKNKSIYENFWKRYKRPPIKEFQDYIIKRRDLLVPQDIRERKGAFFTPKIWVELSQKYLADYLGEDWQEEYYVWDCAAGTGNLLAGLTNRQNIFASTLDQADVNVMHERIKNGANLFKDHVFQFDFLNDEFFDSKQNLYDEHGKKVETRETKSKLPKALQEILKDEEKRKKLLIYINPPYAEAGNARTPSGTGENKTNVTTDNKTYEKYKNQIAKANRELFAQFLIRIYKEIEECKIANFSKLKNLQGINFVAFRKVFTPKLEKLFLIPANTFDNVSGLFPIGFFVWNCAKKQEFKKITADVYDHNKNKLAPKTIYSYGNAKRINDWLIQHHSTLSQKTSILNTTSNDFQHNKYLNISNHKDKGRYVFVYIDTINIIPVSVYFSVRLCIKPTWLNDRDQFLYPKKSWETDIDFQNDCLAFTLFHSQNRITCSEGTNHWIPFTEDQVGNTKTPFESHFMSDFINGRIKKSNGNGDLFNKPKVENGVKCKFSPEAQEVFDAGKELYKYYHENPHKNEKTGIAFNPNASLYDIREYFQGRNEKGKMNSKSSDENYNERIGLLRERMDVLAERIAEKVYEHGFLAR